MSSGELPEGKLAAEWLAATLFLVSGMWLAANVEWVLGTTSASYYGSIALAIILNLLGGIIYISISSEVCKDL